MTFKVLAIVSRMNVGGPAVLLSALSQGLPTTEIEFDLVTGATPVNEIDYLDSHIFDTRVYKIDHLGNSNSIFQDLNAFIRLFFLIRRINPDIIHTHTSRAGFLGRLAGIIAAPKARRIHTFHGHLLYGYFSNFKLKIIISLERLMAMTTHVLIAVSNQVKLDLLQCGVGQERKWKVIYPGIPALTGSRIMSRSNLGYLEQDFVGVWIGRFAPIKNPILAVESIESWVQKYSGVAHFIMVGDGQLLQPCRDFAISRNLPITFTGWQTNIESYLAAADFLLLTSSNEGMPVVIIEAASTGIPTLSTDVGGVHDFIDSEKNGILLGSTPMQIAKKIDLIYRNPDIRQKLGQEAKLTYERNFTQEIMVKAHLDTYNSILGISKIEG